MIKIKIKNSQLNLRYPRYRKLLKIMNRYKMKVNRTILNRKMVRKFSQNLQKSRKSNRKRHLKKIIRA